MFSKLTLEMFPAPVRCSKLIPRDDFEICMFSNTMSRMELCSWVSVPGSLIAENLIAEDEERSHDLLMLKLTTGAKGNGVQGLRITLVLPELIAMASSPVLIVTSINEILDPLST